MSVEELTYALETYIRESSRNYVDEAMALVPSDVGQRLYDTPLVRVGSADDPEWEEMKRPEAVGHLFRTPKEWLPEAVSVVSYFAPFSDFVVEGNKRDAVDVGNGWLYARVEGQAFLTEVNRFLERWFRERGYRAVAPYASAGFRYVFEAGTNAEIADKSLSFTSNWSERHVAYVCGLGTFSLSKGLITERGPSRNAATRGFTTTARCAEPVCATVRHRPFRSNMASRIICAVPISTRCGRSMRRASAAASARSMCRASGESPKKDKFRF